MLWERKICFLRTKQLLLLHKLKKEAKDFCKKTSKEKLTELSKINNNIESKNKEFLRINAQLEEDIKKLENKKNNAELELKEKQIQTYELIKKNKESEKALDRKQSTIDKDSLILKEKEKDILKQQEKLSLKSIELRKIELELEKKESELTELRKSNEKLLNSTQSNKIVRLFL